ncbi:MAG: hypothetical protein KF901_32145 [Myxococcales bacterium]|nr:hypothetical protein [Myxococcales bacterium]
MGGAELPETLARQCREIQDEFDDEVQRLRAQTTRFGDDYLERVLPLELKRLSHVSDAPPDIDLLVLICGTSPQPLLVSAGFVRPRHVLLIGSRTDTGREAVAKTDQHLRGAMRMLSLPEFRISERFIAPSEPVDAYHELARAIRDVATEMGIGLSRTLVDVTGGKKTMVAAAFLVCSELGLRSCYVDAEYDERARMPRPCTSDHRLLGDPIAAFKVRELQRVVQLCRARDYAQALSILDDVAEHVRGSDGASLLDPNMVMRDQRRLRALDAWSSRRFQEIPSHLNGADVPGAGAILDFGARWELALRESKKTWNLDACAMVSEGQLLLEFALHQVSRGRHLHGNDARREGFLHAFAGCDALVDGTLTLLIRKKRILRKDENKLANYAELKRLVQGNILAAIVRDGTAVTSDVIEVKDWPGIGADALFAVDQAARNGRNALLHGIGEPDAPFIDRYFAEGRPEALIESIARALGRTDFSAIPAVASITAAVDALQELEIEAL